MDIVQHVFSLLGFEQGGKAKQSITSGPITLLIDGPSGAGKTTFAKDLRQQWPVDRAVQILHMDDLYPGWSGLAEATRVIADEVMPARIAGQNIRLNTWNWTVNAFDSFVEINHTVDLIIEGCGSMSTQASKVANATIWVTADDATRKDRALSRGGEDFEAHWNSWDEQFQEFVFTHNPQHSASLTVTTSR